MLAFYFFEQAKFILILGLFVFAFCLLKIVFKFQSLSQEDPLEKEMATHSSILACKILWTEEPSGLQSVESQELDTT